MYLETLSLTNFRNYARLDLRLPAAAIILQGANAQGKTNLLEAIYYLATASSPLADADRQLVNWLAVEDILPHTRLVGHVAKAGGHVQIEITLMPVGEVANGSLRKAIRVNGVNRRLSELIGQLNVVLFLPQDISLVDGSPGGRRRYLNALLCQLDARYYRALQEYGQVVYQRNHLLRRLRDRRQDPEQLLFWDQQMAESGGYLVARRRWLVGRLNALLVEIHPQLTGHKEHLQLLYQPSMEVQGVSKEGAQLALGLSEDVDWAAELPGLRQGLAEQLVAGRKQDVARGVSCLGPHRDEMRFLANGIDLNTYGSRGQQRTAALALKLAEVAWFHQETGEMPILLLDDMMSELDPDRQAYLMETLGRAQQVVITTTHVDGFPAGFLEEATVYDVAEGQLGLVKGKA